MGCHGHRGELRPAVLRKDFIFDEYQVYEARAYGADTILLIVKMLPDDRLVDLLACARGLHMEPLVCLRAWKGRTGKAGVGKSVVLLLA